MTEHLPDDLLQRIVDEQLTKILPKPRKGEAKKKFISRCMGDAKVVSEFPDRAQRFQVCQSQAKKRPKPQK
jgi:hypothetical protein